MGSSLESTGIQWHPGFYGAIEIELRSDKETLEFHREYNLSKEPLKMDMLIIKKLADMPVENEIGRLFKKINIIEYKGPGNSLSIDDYYKTVGYACLYKGLSEKVNQIPAEEMTISIFCSSYPRKLFQLLRRAEYTIEERFHGIYYIRGNVPFDTQIIVPNRLAKGAHQSLKLLSPNAEEGDARTFIEEAMKLTEPGDRNNIEAVLQVSIVANKTLYDEIRRNQTMCDALRELMKEEIADAERKAGQEAERKAQLKSIKNLMSNLKLTAEQVMEAMSIPAEEWDFYKANL